MSSPEEPSDLRALIAGLVVRSRTGDREALGRLSEIAVAHPADSVGDHAALGLGSALLSLGRAREAVRPLVRACEGDVAPDYARLLLADAVIDGRRGEERSRATGLLSELADRAVTTSLAAQAQLRLLRLTSTDRHWQDAAVWGAVLLATGAPPGNRDEARWLTAEAMRRVGKHEIAEGLYGLLWRDSPGTPWGDQARGRLEDLGASAEPRGAAERLAWIERLQQAGLQEEALAALEPLLSGQVEAEVRARATFLAVRSHLSLRHDHEVVARAEDLRRASPRSPWAARAALDAMRALARRGHSRGVRAWEEWLRGAHPRTETVEEARELLGQYLAAQGNDEDALRILREVGSRAGSRANHALWGVAWLERRRGRLSAMRESLHALVDLGRGTSFRPAALYWLARLHEDPGGDDARELYLHVVRESPRGYYGWLASDRLRESGEELPERASTAGAFAIDLLRDADRRPELAYRRGVELRLLGLEELAADELETVDSSDDAPLRLAVACMHYRVGNTWKAFEELVPFENELTQVPVAARSVPLVVWKALYPTPHRSAINAAVFRHSSKVDGLDRWLVAAVARRGSQFWPHATSPTGAIGLLQLTPATAATTARRLGRPAPERTALFEPERNLDLGVATFAGHLESFGAIEPSLAAYDAGAVAARGWWARKPEDQPIDEWIESIPYPETQLFVKAVLADWRSYRQLYGHSAP